MYPTWKYALGIAIMPAALPCGTHAQHAACVKGHAEPLTVQQSRQHRRSARADAGAVQLVEDSCSYMGRYGRVGEKDMLGEKGTKGKEDMLAWMQ